MRILYLIQQFQLTFFFIGIDEAQINTNFIDDYLLDWYASTIWGSWIYHPDYPNNPVILEGINYTLDFSYYFSDNNLEIDFSNYLLSIEDEIPAPSDLISNYNSSEYKKSVGISKISQQFLITQSI